MHGDLSKRDLIREYLSYCRVEKGLAANSIDSYATDLGNLSQWAGTGISLICISLTRQDLREWLIDLGGREAVGELKTASDQCGSRIL